jgi:hypothetical protein
MRCPKPQLRESINQLLPTGPLGTGDLGMGRVKRNRTEGKHMYNHNFDIILPHMFMNDQQIGNK